MNSKSIAANTAEKLSAFLGDVLGIGENRRIEPTTLKSEGKRCSGSPSDKTEFIVANGNGRSSVVTNGNNGARKNLDWSSLEGVFSKDFSSSSGKEKSASFLACLSDMLANYVHSESDRSAKVLDFHHPHQLKEMMSHCLDLHPEPKDLEQLLSDCRETLKYCVKTGHPHFFNQLSTGADVIGLAGAWLAATANTNMFTYEIAPVFTLMEEVILTRMRTLIGWDDGEAMFAPGGAISNMYAVLMARHRYSPDVKTKGMVGARRMVVMTSEQSHFSIKRAAVMLGLGSDNVINIKADTSGKMDMADLRTQIEAVRNTGGDVIMINATCGTTVLGAIDPINPISDICEEFGIWMHCDCAWGGGILMSRDQRYLLDGIHKADSVTWNPHKMMGVPLQCSAYITKHKKLLNACNSMNAAYLFQQDKHYDLSYDTGDMSVQCGRHNDVFKLWLMWRAKGDQGFEDQINHNFKIATYLRNSVRSRPGFHLVLDEFEAPNVCFWYIPQQWRVKKFESIKSEHVHKVTPAVKAAMMEAGTLMVQYQPLGALPNFFRVAISNPVVTPRDIDFLLDEIDLLGKDIPLPSDF